MSKKTDQISQHLNLAANRLTQAMNLVVELQDGAELSAERIGSLIYQGYPVSYWHQQAVHYRQRMIEIARQSDMAIDAEPSPNGIERD